MRKRLTIQRKLVYDAVITLANHPTALDIHKKVQETHLNISIATVYSNLKHLAEEGYVSILSFLDSSDRYDAILEEHYHIKCLSCGSFIDLIMECPPNINEKAVELSGCIIKKHDIIFHGICTQCQEKSGEDQEKTDSK